MTAAWSALAAAFTAALLVGPRHRPIQQLRPAARRMQLRRLPPLLGGRVIRIAGPGLAGAAGFMAGGALVAIACLLAAVALLSALRDRRIERSRTERQAVTEALLDALSAELGSGATPAEAVAAAMQDAPSAVRAELDPVARALRSGADPAAAWRAVRSLTHSNALAAVFRVCEDTGASLATVLNQLAAMAADERHRRDEIALALAGPRSSAVLLAGLPALGVLAGAGLGASPLPFLLSTPAGHWCFLLGVGLDVLGARWVARLAASAGRSPTLS